MVLNNIKGFEQADIDLCPDGDEYPGWAVVTGDNGAGKTAFIKAISLAILGPDQARSIVPDLRGWVTEGQESGSISVEIKPNHEWDKTVRGGNPVQGTFWAEVEVTRNGPTWDLAPTDIFRNKKKGAFTGPWSLSTNGWFALGYGPFRRLYGSSPDAQRLMVIPGRIPRFATLFKEDATLGEVEEWAKQLMYRKLEQREHERKTLDMLLTLLRDDFLRQGMTIKDVNSDGIWLLDQAGRRMSLTDMSEGYRSALAMLMDIFRHMVDVYGPDGLLEEGPNGVFLRRPGVVIIDEVDAHLHPAWQREIGFWLKRHFPLIQFIVTTHSPLVCQAADNGRIYHLPQPGVGEPFILTEDEFNKVIAGKADEILLTPAFGLEHTRSPRAVESRRRHAQLRAKARMRRLSEGEEQEMEQLSLFTTV
ncbi:AAA family ATPase [Actinoplanes lobatus]|uniref:Uncharacterized protein n=1 Tax=Actinoplanes lobatus TaxID=113568 RepID=A0A7W7HR44_9ACTN|nr:AAA family ATPase [Actinoplanes lobatus]MBB4755181.1 hypothetical protein [Actinoplanes lobatus]